MANQQIQISLEAWEEEVPSAFEDLPIEDRQVPHRSQCVG